VEQLFGAYHPAAARPAKRTGVVLCSPFGVEAIYSHRMYRVLAERLARAGFHTLRFDYYGTGDSAGDSGSGGLARWSEDLLTASDELMETAGLTRVAWVGLRLGGSIAALASTRLRPPAGCLVLWDPVTNGREYLDEMQAEHRSLIESDFEIRSPRWLGGERGPDESSAGALGFPLPAALREELETLDESLLASARAERVYLLTQRPVPEDRRSVPDSRLVWRTTPPSPSWNSERSMNAALVPAAVLDMIVDTLEEAK